MPPTRVDTILDSLADIRETLGGFGNAIKHIEDRAKEDRDLRSRQHEQNQQAMGELRQATAGSIAELRKVATERWGETTKAVQEQGRKLDEHAAAVSAMQQGSPLSKLRLGVFAAIGLFTVTVMGLLCQSVFQWAVQYFLKTKLGG